MVRKAWNALFFCMIFLILTQYGLTQYSNGGGHRQRRPGNPNQGGGAVVYPDEIGRPSEKSDLVDGTHASASNPPQDTLGANPASSPNEFSGNASMSEATLANSELHSQVASPSADISDGGQAQPDINTRIFSGSGGLNFLTGAINTAAGLLGLPINQESSVNPSQSHLQNHDYEACSAPRGTRGKCVFAKNCMYREYATNEALFAQYACVLRQQYVGLCCPESYIRSNQGGAGNQGGYPSTDGYDNGQSGNNGGYNQGGWNNGNGDWNNGNSDWNAGNGGWNNGGSSGWQNGGSGWNNGRPHGRPQGGNGRPHGGNNGRPHGNGGWQNPNQGRPNGGWQNPNSGRPNGGNGGQTNGGWQNPNQGRPHGGGNQKPHRPWTDAEKQTSAALYADCGINIKTRIVGGMQSEQLQWPWMGALLRPSDLNQPFCGGALINERCFLTAAHCTNGMSSNDIMVRLGEYDFSRSDDDRHQDFRIAQIKQHESYEKKTNLNDISILILDRPAQIGDDVRPICLPDPNQWIADKQATVAGWGTMSYGGNTSPVLRHVTVPIWKNPDCYEALKKNITRNFLCAGRKEGGQDSCQGDSGGPLMFQDDSNRWHAVGVVSWGIRCAEPNSPGVYTRVTKYTDWIMNQCR